VGWSKEKEMTRDEIVLMARKADLWITSDERWAAVVRFANLVAAAEREACAKVCEEIANKPSNMVLGVALDCAAAIRARGEE
jgi:hypothetical protein